MLAIFFVIDYHLIFLPVGDTCLEGVVGNSSLPIAKSKYDGLNHETL